MTEPTAADIWRQFGDLTLAEKEAVLASVRMKLMQSQDLGDEELRPFTYLLPTLELKIEEHKAAASLLELMVIVRPA